MSNETQADILAEMRNIVDWSDICAKCADGEIEPRQCEYYGEPAGCNSPTYHEHPPATPQGGGAALWAALKAIARIAGPNPARLSDASRIRRISEIAEEATSGQAPEINEHLARCVLLEVCLELQYLYDTEMRRVLWGPYHLLEKVKFALAAPPRNCDVGTAEEQMARFDAYCQAHFYYDSMKDSGGDCHRCPLMDVKECSCQLAWAQMPYENGGAE